jgi:hypothetical protein
VVEDLDFVDVPLPVLVAAEVEDLVAEVLALSVPHAVAVLEAEVEPLKVVETEVDTVLVAEADAQAERVAEAQSETKGLDEAEREAVRALLAVALTRSEGDRDTEEVREALRAFVQLLVPVRRAEKEREGETVADLLASARTPRGAARASSSSAG